MKVSLNWIRQFTEVTLPVDELVAKLGAQLGAVEEVINFGEKYQGIIIAKVVSCVKHPNADKLHVCLIDDGGKAENVERDEKGLVQVVCGAPNVREGLSVAWLPPGTTVPSSSAHEPFVLEARDIRGQKSNGMLASASELAISEDHSGILEVDINATPGMDFAEAYEMNDHVIDIENKMFTHRPDCFGILGVAREIAGITGKQFKSPDWYLTGLGRIKPGPVLLPLEVRNEAGDSVPRFMAVAMSGIKVGASPFGVQTYLMRCGIRPINNIVDVTNYLMLLTGQPLHAYDYDKVKSLSDADGAILIARPAGVSEKLPLLNGKVIEPREGTLLIATDKRPIGMAGVMGGADTEVDEKTENIILECANFDMYAVRRASMAHGLFTDAVTRFNKGQSPLQNDRVLEEAVETIQYLTGAHVASAVTDITATINEPRKVQVTAGFVNARLGLSCSAEEMAQLLRQVEVGVVVDNDSLTISAPFWRTDIQIPEDVVEEIGRLLGYDKLPLELPLRTIRPVKRNATLDFKQRLRGIMSSLGSNEVLTYSFVHGDLIDKVGQDKERAHRLSNALSPQLQYYRMSLTPSLLSLVHPNIKAGNSEFGIFEINQAHNRTQKEENEPELPKELASVSFVYASKNPTASAAYYHARKVLDGMAESLGMRLKYTAMSEELDFPLAKPYEVKRSAVIFDEETGTQLGIIGEFKANVRHNLKLPLHTSGFELGLDELRLSSRNAAYRPLSRFPRVVQDITLKTPKDLQYGKLLKSLGDALNVLITSDMQAEIETLDIYQKAGSQHVTFRLSVAHYNKTLLSQEVNQLLDELAKRVGADCQAERI